MLRIRRFSSINHVCRIQNGVKVTWSDGIISCFHPTWLRDHCECPKCKHPTTKQRLIDTWSIPLESNFAPSHDNNALSITWNDNVSSGCSTSQFDIPWLLKHRMQFASSDRQQQTRQKDFWIGKDFDIPCVSFDDFMTDQSPGLTQLYQSGLLKVTETPQDMASTEAFARKIAFVKETLYGRMWTTSPENPEEDFNDTAASNLELFHHTDCTYLRDPPALQIFNCVRQSKEGGISRFMDGFKVALELKERSPKSFQFFCETPILFECFDDGYFLQTKEPMIQLDQDGNVIQFRHNDTDRAPLTHLSMKQVNEFYQHHQKLLEIIRDPAMEVKVQLSPGDMIVVDNHRVMHGRYAFLGKRALIGCYLGRDEYDSRLRLLGII